MNSADFLIVLNLLKILHFPYRNQVNGISLGNPKQLVEGLQLLCFSGKLQDGINRKRFKRGLLEFIEVEAEKLGKSIKYKSYRCKVALNMESKT